MSATSVGGSDLMSPYPHHVFNSALDKNDFEYVAEWMRSHALWKRKVTEFYDQFNCLNVDALLDSRRRPDVVARVRRAAEDALGKELHDYCELTAHRMVGGQAIGIHNDDPADDDPDFEDVRVLLFVGRSDRQTVPGILLLDRRIPDADVQAVEYEFTPNVAVCIPLGTSSFHAVLQVEGGYRDTLLFSFWSKNRGLPHRSGDGTAKLGDGNRNHFLFYQILDELFPLLGAKSHSGGQLVTHLVGTYEILRLSRASDAVCLAGLVHSINGTSRFQMPFSQERQECLLEICNASGELGREILTAVASFEKVLDLVRAGENPANRLANDESLLDGLLVDIANDIEQLSRSDRRTADVLCLLDKIAAVQEFGDYRFDVSFSSRVPRVTGLDRGLAKKLWPDLQFTEADEGILALSSPPLCRAAEKVGRAWYDVCGLTPQANTNVIGRSTLAGPFDYFLLHHSQVLPLWGARRLLDHPARIIHCDSHSDLGRLPIIIAEGEIHCSVTGRSFGPLSSPDFDEMIRRGVITIGNFLTMALLVGKCAELWFVSHENHGLIRETLHLNAGVFTEGGRTFRCIRASPFTGEVVRSVSAVSADANFLGEAFATTDEVIFDLDADYFCNRHDNEKDCFCGGVCDPLLVTADVSATLETLNKNRQRLISSTCALSPGFFGEHYAHLLGAEDLLWA